MILQKYKSGMARATNDIVRSAARAASHHLVMETPVKRGVARSNWVATLNDPFEGVLPAYHPIIHLGGGPAPVERKGETENASAAMAQNSATAASFDVLRHRRLVFRNNVGYIGDLNSGWSAQSAPGWFEGVVPVMLVAIAGKWRIAL